jgi:hypothetical protein
LAKAAQQYVGIMDGKLVCHTGVIQAPLRKGFKQVHRLVVIPDYQGVGIGTNFITFVAKEYHKQDLIMKLITTTPAIRFSLDRHPRWVLTRSGKVQPNGNKKYMTHLNNSQSSNRITYTYVYDEPVRFCECCGKEMNSGYVIHDGEEYFCSDDCLSGWYSPEEYDELCQIDEAYWTEW